MSAYRTSPLAPARRAPRVSWWRRLRAWSNGTLDEIALRRAGWCWGCRRANRTYPYSVVGVPPGCRSKSEHCYRRIVGIGQTDRERAFLDAMTSMTSMWGKGPRGRS